VATSTRLRYAGIATGRSTGVSGDVRKESVVLKDYVKA
jgi:hypothetical protein